MIDVPSRNAEAEAAARARQALLTKPAGALGRLEDLAIWVASVQGRCPPRPFARIRVVIFAGDHGVASAGVSAYPAEVTGQMVANFLAGGAAVNVLARQAGATVRVVDMAVDGDTPAEIAEHKVRRGSARIDREDALTTAETQAAFDAGRTIADEEVDAGADLLVPGDMGIGNTTSCAVLIAALTDQEATAVTGRGTGIDDAGWMRKVTVVRDALRRARRAPADPIALLGCAGGADLAAMTGFLVQAALRRTPVLLDGVVSATCAVLADTVAPGARQWWLAGSRSPEPAQRAALERLELTPILDLGLRLGEGTGGLLAVPVLAAAVATLAEMATFGESGVTAGA
ncbi:MAG: nicotinate-nucleotide--dimethylbenzimidazole phosphoribosyltransferase [Frankiaceae bacterium]|jgi:nicotinate-nucleotide--dimethylbenzimidazole phosphoribosyltransferase